MIVKRVQHPSVGVAQHDEEPFCGRLFTCSRFKLTTMKTHAPSQGWHRYISRWELWYNNSACVECFSTVLQCSLVPLKPETRANPSSNLGRGLGAITLGAWLASRLLRPCVVWQLIQETFTESGWVEGCVYTCFNCLRRRPAGCCTSGIKKLGLGKDQIGSDNTHFLEVIVCFLMVTDCGWGVIRQ